MRASLTALLLVTMMTVTGCLGASEPGNDDAEGDGATSERTNERARKITICHSGDTITVTAAQLLGHLLHGDYLGTCHTECWPGALALCYDGPAATQGEGTCHLGIKLCNSTGSAWSACFGEVVPEAEVCGDRRDTNCDGDVDEGCDCTSADDSFNCTCAADQRIGCYTGPAGTEGVGACRAGSEMCNHSGTGYGACVGSITPVAEVCGDGVDNDCDGATDEGCVCTPGSAASCYGGPTGTDGVGACHAGQRACNAVGTAWGPCTGAVTPIADTCGDGIDNDCDGTVDQGCVCAPGSTAACYGGPPGSDGVGTCHAGTMTCNPSGTAYGACAGEADPQLDACGDGLDNDCDGTPDDGCVCAPGSTASCYGGDAGTDGVGTCHAGAMTCNATGTGYGACTGDVTPAADVCGDGSDTDCDGIADDGCICAAGTTAACYDGPSGTEGVGACAAGEQTCAADGRSYGACTGAITPAADVCGDDVDNDCDGIADDGCVCVPDSTASCYGGPAGTEGVGTCSAGTQLCNGGGTAYGACVGDTTPAAEVCGDGLDNNCDGVIDDSCVCAPGSTASCYGGPSDTADVGACRAGAMTCNATGTGYGACVGDVTPTDDVCGDGSDTDCNGTVDDGCICTAGESAACYDGPSGTLDIGVCVAGIEICAEDGRSFGPCLGAVTPIIEVCGDGLDDNCDGTADDFCVCLGGELEPCYDGPAGTEGVGSCSDGIQTCNAVGTGFGVCIGAIGPTAEVCGDGRDNDCDGVADDGCVCAPGSLAACYDGPDGTGGAGTCHAGVMLCNPTGTGYGACLGEVTPADDTCGDALDNDCDGTPDDGCVCAPGSAAACYNGPAGTAHVGTCADGTMTCNAVGTAYGACVGSIGPAAEVCGDALDNDCDGVADDSCVCVPFDPSSCYDGPPGTAGVGACRAGARTCNSTGTGYGTCSGAITPVTEVCGDGIDNDCDGASDEGCVCVPASTTTCYDGPANTVNVGVCHAGTETCNAAGSGYGACGGEVTPSGEVCGDGLDNDCDGFVDEGCIGDLVWNDLDRDGIQDVGEPGLAGVRLRLFNFAGTGLGTTLSDANGIYHFGNVPTGLYRVQADIPVGYTGSPFDRGTNDNLDSDLSGAPTAWSSAFYTFPVNASISHIDAGFYLTPPP